jgi:hypothetical protein
MMARQKWFSLDIEFSSKMLFVPVSAIPQIGRAFVTGALSWRARHRAADHL